MAQTPNKLAPFNIDRLTVNAALVVLAFAAFLALESQSAASWFTYVLTVACFATLHRWIDVFRTKLAVGLVAVLSYFLITCFWSEPFAWRDVVSILGRCLILFAFLVTFAECQWRGYLHHRLCEVVGGMSAVAAIAAIYFYFVDPPPFDRLLGLGQLDNNVVAGIVFSVAVVMLVHAIVYKTGTVLRTGLLLLALGILLYAVWLTGSRNAWVCLAAGLGSLILLRASKDFASFSLVLFLLGIIVLSLVWFFAERYENFQLMLLPRGDSHRLEIWQAAIERIGEVGWIFGGGINSSDDFVGIAPEVIEHAHNLYLSIVLQGGLFGLFLVVLLECWVFRILAQHFDSDDAKLAFAISCMAFVFYILDGHEYIDKIGVAWLLIWLPVGVALGIEWRHQQWNFMSETETA